MKFKLLKNDLLGVLWEHGILEYWEDSLKEGLSTKDYEAMSNLLKWLTVDDGDIIGKDGEEFIILTPEEMILEYDEGGLRSGG